MYHLPLLPGYGPNSNIRSSVAAKSKSGKSLLSRLSEAEENGYQGTYFTSPATPSPNSIRDGYITSSSPVDTRKSIIKSTPASEITTFLESETEQGTHNGWNTDDQVGPEVPPQPQLPEEDVAEVVFFEYGVVVFFGLNESQEGSILEDIDNAGIMKRKMEEKDWEVEECHFAVRYLLPPVVYQSNQIVTARSVHRVPQNLQ